MMRNRAPTLFFLLIIPWLLTGCWQKVTELTPPPPRFRWESPQEKVIIRAVNEQGSVVFHIYGAEGSGQATIQRVEGTAPATIQARLYMDSLALLKLTYGDVTILASISEADPPQETLLLAGGKAPIGPESPYWLSIQSLPPQPGAKLFGMPALPGSFLITLPQDFYWGRHTTFTLHWSDHRR